MVVADGRMRGERVHQRQGNESRREVTEIGVQPIVEEGEMEVIDVVIMIETGRGIEVHLRVVAIGMIGIGTGVDIEGMIGILGGAPDGIIVISGLLLQRSRDGVWSFERECTNSGEGRSVERGRRKYVTYVR